MAVEASEYLKAREQSAQLEPTRAPIPYPQVYPNDEIDLVELGASLLRRWKLMLTVFLACVGGGILAAFLVPRSYAYATTIQVGMHVVGDATQPVEPPDAAAKKLENAYLPQAVLQYAQAHGIDPRSLRLHASSPDKTNLVVIEGKAPHSLQTAYLAVERAAAEKLVQSEDAMTRAAAAQLRSQLAEERADLAALHDPADRALLQTQITSLQQQAASLQKPQIVASPMASLEPVGFGRGVIAILGVVAGVILALLSAAIANYGVAVGRRLAGPESVSGEVSRILGRAARRA